MVHGFGKCQLDLLACGVQPGGDIQRLAEVGGVDQIELVRKEIELAEVFGSPFARQGARHASFEAAAHLPCGHGFVEQLQGIDGDCGETVIGAAGSPDDERTFGVGRERPIVKVGPKTELFLGRAVEEILYPAMEDYQLDIMIGEGPAARSIKLDLPEPSLLLRRMNPKVFVVPGSLPDAITT